ncbi:MAG: ROK family protein, partial [Planctomycetes bacterium]|nr:ROK family protein [Planctomycetota bacterium]
MSDLFAGVDLGGTSIKAAVADGAGDVLLTRLVPTESHRGPEDVVRRIGALVCELIKELGGDRAGLAGLGMGVPGLVDCATGVTKFLPNLPTQWREVPVAALLHDQLACPVRLLND